MTLIDKERLINDMLADMCDLMGKMIALIPPEHPELRLSACAFLLEEINSTIKRTLSVHRTEH